ncbi:type IV pilin accessory protein [Acinetobacter sp. ANC 3832]|nr:type IV pilin accessory protein [Acinetobacter sp. ANC 3832]
MNAKNRFLLTHLSVSLFVALLAIIIVFVFWYPSPINKALGVTHIFLMMLAIDVVIGPILGWFVYKEGKKSLKFDLMVIIFLQMIALGYGIYSIAQARPAWLVFNVDRFELVKNNEIDRSHIIKAKPEYQSSPFLKPEYVAVKNIENNKEKNELMMQEIFKGVSLAQRPELYQPLDLAKGEIQKRCQKLDILIQFNDQNDVNKILAKFPQATAWLPLQTHSIDMVVLINKEKAGVVEIVDLRPWK